MADTKISGLTAASTLDGTELYPADQGGNSRKVSGTQIQAMVLRAGTATAGSWPVLGSGTVLTSPVAGTIEFDGTSWYFTPAASSRAVACTEYFICLSATHTLTSTTSAQAIFDSVAAGTLTLPTGLYFFDCLLSLSAMSSTTGNAKFDVLGAGTATVGSVLYYAVGIDGATGAAANQTGSTSVTVGSPASIVSGGTGTAMQVSIRGTFRVTVSGTIIPSIALVTAATAVVAVGSYFRCRIAGGSGATNVGNWS